MRLSRKCLKSFAIEVCHFELFSSLLNISKRSYIKKLKIENFINILVIIEISQFIDFIEFSIEINSNISINII